MMGSLYKQKSRDGTPGRVWWAKYYVNGRAMRESTGTKKEVEAKRFLRLRDELVFSTRSWRYFDAILWPRMVRLVAPRLLPPAERSRTRRRGPSLSTLEHLITEVEKRP